MIILHSDLNNFYASVECITNPEIAEGFVAVCGSEEDRHGIVLAKNEKAKKRGVKTGDTVWEAKRKCPGLIIVPPHFEKYRVYSERVKEIYKRYTDKIESFGPDECWLDVSASVRLFGSGEKIANEIRKTVKRETGLTVSVGVSFNKVFAKIGSDLKKPDAVSVITKENFKSVVWPLNIHSMLGVGSSTAKKLRQYKIETIGDLANTPVEFMKKIFGKNGVWMHNSANGIDLSPVSHMDYKPIPKSVGRGITLRENLTDKGDVWKVIYSLSLSVEKALRCENLKARSVGIAIKNSQLETVQIISPLSSPTHSAYDIAKKAYETFIKKYVSERKTICVRSVSVRAINLCDENEPIQVSLFDSEDKLKKAEKFEKTFCDLKQKYGGNIINYASLMGDLKFPKNVPPKTDLPRFK